MKLIITESQALFLEQSTKDKALSWAGEKITQGGRWVGNKAMEKGGGKLPSSVTKVAGNLVPDSPVQLSPEIAQRFDDIDIERDAPNLHKFLNSFNDQTAASGMSNIFKTNPELLGKLGVKDMVHPLGRKARISSPFGQRRAPLKNASDDHSGIDFEAVSGSRVYAPLDGVVTRAESVPAPDGCGGHVRIKHNDKMDTKFCHLKKWKVRVGDKVKRGDLIGFSGGDEKDPHRGTSTGPHLHYAIVVDGQHVDPATIQKGLS